MYIVYVIIPNSYNEEPINVAPEIKRYKKSFINMKIVKNIYP